MDKGYLRDQQLMRCILPSPSIHISVNILAVSHPVWPRQTEASHINTHHAPCRPSVRPLPHILWNKSQGGGGGGGGGWEGRKESTASEVESPNTSNFIPAAQWLRSCTRPHCPPLPTLTIRFQNRRSPRNGPVISLGSDQTLLLMYTCMKLPQRDGIRRLELIVH